MIENIIIKPSVRKQFDIFLRRERVLFFSAPCGFGKTVLVDALLESLPAKSYKVCRLNAGEAGFDLSKTNKGWDILVIDDLHFMQEEHDWIILSELIRTNPEQRFILLSRGVPYGCLMAFQYAGLMTVLEAEDLLFDCDDIRNLLEGCGIHVTDREIESILKESIGYPLGVMITARLLSGGKPMGPEIVAKAFREVFLYFETAVYRRFDLPMRHFLLDLAPFEQFDLEMAKMVSGDPHAGELLEWLLRNTTMLRYDDAKRFHFWPQFRDFLLWQMTREYTEEKHKAILERGGLYYELKEDYAHALEYYTKGGDHSKVSDLLVRNAQLHPGMGYYSEMEMYYRSLPETEIQASPSLMQGMSMLCALAMDYTGSERWYRELQDFSQRCEKLDAAGKQARGRLAWLDIALPQRGIDGLTNTIPAIFEMMTNKAVTLPPFSVTSTLPSIMNGGKDFSEWSKKDDLLYKTLRIPVEAILGKDGIGLADCAIAESKFEKGEDISGRMLSLISNINEVQQRGTPDIEFAVGGLLVRSQLASGLREDARHSIVSLREKFEERGLKRFMPNIDAMMCRIDLLIGDLDSADAWYGQKAPRDPMHLNVMKRYQYFTQAMVELAEDRPDTALLTLSLLERYVKNCARHIDSIHLNVLTAIALYRKKDSAWQEHLTKALDTAADYRFVRTISVYGIAILPLLEEQSHRDNSRWYKRLISETRTQAAFYPDFLETRLAPQDKLTPMELQILHLICADKSNAEIAQIMDVKLSTVKTHVSHILTKLNVSRRSEAKTVAGKLRLVSDSV